MPRQLCQSSTFARPHGPQRKLRSYTKKYPNFKYIQTNVTEEPSVEKAIDMIVENEGRIDGMVANAGMTKRQPALQFKRRSCST